MFDELTAKADVLIRKGTGADVSIPWQFPREADRGDLATSAPLALAKSLKKPPMEIAGEIASSLQSLDGVARVEAIAPGYVNLWLDPATLLAELTVTQKGTVPTKTRKKEKPVIVDYSSPNIAKPLGVHHVINMVVGQALVNLYRHTGWNVIAWSYPGDWGTQFGKLAVAYEKWGKEKDIGMYSIDDLLRLYVKFHEEAEKQPSLEDEARAAFAKMEAGDADLRAFWKTVLDTSFAALEDVYRRLQVKLDVVTGESYYEDKMAPILQEGTKKGVFTEGEGGSLIAPFAPDADMPPALLRKGDGSTLYITRDLAMIRYRIDEYGPKALYYVVDVAQSLHFRQLFTVAKMLGWKLPELEHVVFGRMRFADADMSTRKGNVLKLDDALDEAVRRADAVIGEHGDSIQTDDRAGLAEMMGIGAVVYGILSQNRKMDIVFDWGKMLSFEGNSAPYLQYTHARARSVLRKAAGKVPKTLKGIPELSAKERLLVRTLLLFPDTLAEARDTRMPHKLTNYLYQLAQDFNAFYNTESILNAEGSSRDLRLQLTDLTASVLRTGAELLTLRVPDRM